MNSIVQRRRLKFVATLNEDSLPESTDPDYEMEYIDIGNVDSSGRINERTTYKFAAAPSRARRKVEHGDVIISTVRTYLQAIAPIENPEDNLIVSTGFAVARPNRALLDTKYFKYALREPRFLNEVVARSTGMSYPAINSSELADITVCIHELKNQRDIAAYLDRETGRIDALVTEKERMLVLLEQKRAALISRAVTCGLNPQAPTKPSGLDWLGEIPKHWKVQRCATLFVEKDERGEPELPLLNVSLNTGVTLRVFSEDKIESMASDLGTMKIAREGDLVFNKMRFWQGAAGIAPADGLVSPDYTVATISKSLHSDYVEKLFRTTLFNAIVRRYSYGMVDDRLRLYWDEFKNIRIPVPPLDEQEAIISHIQTHQTRNTALETALRDSIALLKERRSALITAAVTGMINPQVITT
jgi:type I restriction enzyme S subunit